MNTCTSENVNRYTHVITALSEHHFRLWREGNMGREGGQSKLKPEYRGLHAVPGVALTSELRRMRHGTARCGRVAKVCSAQSLHIQHHNQGP